MSEPEIDLAVLATPLTESEKAELVNACRDALTPAVAFLLRRLMLSSDAAERETKASHDLHELRYLLYQDGWIGTGTPQAALAWRLGNHAEAKKYVVKLEAERDAAIKAWREAIKERDEAQRLLLWI